MQVASLFFILWIIVCGFWLVNHFFYSNQKYDMEYRQGDHVHY